MSSGIDFFRIKKMEDLSREAMLSILRNYPVISLSLESDDYQTEFFVGIPSTKVEHDEDDYASVYDVKLYDEVEEDEDGDIEFRKTELLVFPNTKSCCDYAVEGILDINQDLENVLECFEEDTVMSWLRGERIQAKSKYNQTIIESSNMKEYYQKLFSDNEYDAHEWNARYSEEHHGELFMNELAMKTFGFTALRDGKSRNTDVSPVPLEWRIDTDIIFKEIADEGIEFYQGYCYVHNLSECEFSHDGEEFIRNIVDSHMHYERLVGNEDKESNEEPSRCSPVPSQRF